MPWPGIGYNQLRVALVEQNDADNAGCNIISKDTAVPERSLLKEVLYIVPFVVAFGGLVLLYQADAITNLLLIALSSITLITAIVFTFLRYSSFKSLIVIMVICIPLFLAEFALIFAQLGIIGPDNTPTRPMDYLYFSIVTFTTLGYGDFRPSEAARPFAAMEALLGYVMLGLFVSVLIMINQSNMAASRATPAAPPQPPRPESAQKKDESLRLKMWD